MSASVTLAIPRGDNSEDRGKAIVGRRGSEAVTLAVYSFASGDAAGRELCFVHLEPDESEALAAVLNVYAAQARRKAGP